MGSMRTFIGLELTPHVCSRAVSLQESLARTGTDVKWTEKESIHLTLLFLGDVDDRDLNDVCKAVKNSVSDHRAFQISVEGVGCFPNKRRPRVVWIGIGEGSEEVIALHDAMEDPLLELGCYRREERKYTPHITLGRVKGNTSTDALAELVTKKEAWHAGEVMIKEVVVFSSEMTKQGPIYSVLSRVPLQK